MNQYEKAHVVSKIDGYFLPGPIESHEQAFLRAQRETIAAYRRTLANLESLTWEQFRIGRKDCQRTLASAIVVDDGEILKLAEGGEAA